LQQKYIPTGAMMGDIRLEIVLAERQTGLVSGDADPTWTVDNVELMTETVELAPDAATMIDQANPEGYLISFETFGEYANSVPVGSGMTNLLIPARYSSLKTLFTVMRDASYITDPTKKSISARIKPFTGNGAQWYFSIGGKNIPATPIKDDVEAYAELSKSLHSLAGVNYTSQINKADWIAAADGAYIIAQELESQPHKSTLHEAGVNTLAVNVHLIADFAAPLPVTSQVTTFAHHDSLLIIQNGVASVRY